MRGKIESSILMEDGSMKLQKVLAGVMVAALALTAAPVGNVKAADGVPVDEEHFPDENFRAYVSEKCDTDGNGMLSDGEIAEVTSADIQGRDIADITGIEYFTALIDLNCEFNLLTTLDVSNNTVLTNLDCSGNQLTTLDVSNNTVLTGLDCGFNQLTTLDVSQNTELTELYCSGNQLTTLDVSKNTALTKIWCTFNQLTTLDVSKNTALDYLFCYDNQLTTLDVSKNTALTGLYCSHNYFTEVDVSELNFDDLYTDGQIDSNRKVLIVEADTPSDPPVAEPDKTVSIGEKVTFKAKKKIAFVDGFDPEIVKVKTKKKKVIVTGKAPGTVTVMAYNKKGKEVGSWVVKVE